MPFSGSEAVELGIQIEINGRDFYSQMFEKSKNSKAKEIFRYLAGEEEKHIFDFKKILDSVHQYQPKESYPQEYFAYLRAIADGCVFTQKNKGKEIAGTMTSDIQAIDFGMGAEKDSILFYQGMKKIVPEGDEGLLDELIKQEQQHLSKLWDLKSKL